MRVQRSITINTTVEEVHKKVATLEHWRTWSPWFKRGPNIAVTDNDVPAGKDARYEWKGNKDIGEGAVEITAAAPSQSLKTVLCWTGRGNVGLSDLVVCGPGNGCQGL